LCAQVALARKNKETSSSQMPEQKRAIHALSRLTFGPRPGDTNRVMAMGVDNWIDQQLHPDKIDDHALEARLAPLRTLRMDTREIVENFPPDQVIKAVAEGKQSLPSDPSKRDEFLEGMDAKQRETLMALNNPQQVVVDELVQAKLLRAIYSERQLQEVMTDFWFNHFNVFIGKGADRYLLTSYERDVIRPHAMGKFEDLLVATAQSPAMLFYLDNWLSVGPNSEIANGLPKRNRRRSRYRPPVVKQAKGRRSGLNENYGRELVELH